MAQAGQAGQGLAVALHGQHRPTGKVPGRGKVQCVSGRPARDRTAGSNLDGLHSLARLPAVRIDRPKPQRHPGSTRQSPPDTMATALAPPTSRPPVAAAAQAPGRQSGALTSSWRPAALPSQLTGRRAAAAATASSRRRAPAHLAHALFGGLGAVFKNDPAERTRKQYQDRVDQINALEPDMQRLSDEQLRQLTAALRQRAQGGEALDALLVEAFAVRGLWGWLHGARVQRRRCEMAQGSADRSSWPPRRSPNLLPPPTSYAAGARGLQARAGAATL